MVIAYFLRKVNFERDRDKEYMVKAAMLVKFHWHTKWPPSTGTKGKAPRTKNKKTTDTCTICIVGKNPFARKKPRSVFTAADERDDNRKYEILTGDAYKKQFCHIVFIAKSSQKKVDDILDALKTLPTLTVSDIPGFAKMGGNIEMIDVTTSEKDQTIKLIVNEEAALAKGLTFDNEIRKNINATFIRKSN